MYIKNKGEIKIGLGDEVIGSGLARGAAARGKRVAFGDGHRIIHHRHATEIFKNNPNIAPPGSEGSKDLEWIKHYPGSRVYCSHATLDRFIWSPGHVINPGEMFFSDEELRFAEGLGKNFVVMEPCAAARKSYSVNRQWPIERFVQVAEELNAAGHEIVQFQVPPPYGPSFKQIWCARQIVASPFRRGLAVLARAKLFIGGEGGLAHGAAAVGVPAVVIFGGWVSPEVTGYSSHHNIYAGGQPCGSFTKCRHCIASMNSISVQRVMDAIQGELNRGNK